jgi:hypothetical protein
MQVLARYMSMISGEGSSSLGFPLITTVGVVVDANTERGESAELAWSYLDPLTTAFQGTSLLRVDSLAPLL